jgi:hypothetical protein
MCFIALVIYTLLAIILLTGYRLWLCVVLRLLVRECLE